MTLRRILLFVVAAVGTAILAVMLQSPMIRHSVFPDKEWKREVEQNRVLTAEAEAFAAKGEIAEAIEALEQRPFGFGIDSSFEYNTIEVLLRNSALDVLVEYLERRTPVDGGRCLCSDFEDIKRITAIVSARIGALDTAGRILPLIKQDWGRYAAQIEIGVETARRGNLEGGLEILDQISNTSVPLGAYEQIAENIWRNGDLGAARYVLEHAEARTRALKDKEKLVSGIVSIAVAYAEIGEVETASRFLNDFPEFVIKQPADESAETREFTVVTLEDEDARLVILSAIARAHVRNSRFGYAVEISEEMGRVYPYQRDQILLDVVESIYRQDWTSQQRPEKLALAVQLLDRVEDVTNRNGRMSCEVVRYAGEGDRERATLALDAISGTVDWLIAYVKSQYYWNSAEDPCKPIIVI